MHSGVRSSVSFRLDGSRTELIGLDGTQAETFTRFGARVLQILGITPPALVYLEKWICSSLLFSCMFFPSVFLSLLLCELVCLELVAMTYNPRTWQPARYQTQSTQDLFDD